MIRVICACGRAFKAEDRHAGKSTKCPECGADLTIGPAPISTSPGGDANEVPAWWFPSDPTALADRATAPTRSGSDPGADAANTMVLPPGYNPSCSNFGAIASRRRSTDHGLAEGSGRDPIAGAGASLLPGQEKSGRSPAGPSLFWFSLLGRLSGSAHLLLAQTSYRRTAGRCRASRNNLARSTNSRPAVPGGNPPSSEKATSSGSTRGSAGDASPSGPQAQIAGHPETAGISASGRLRLLVPAYIYPGGDGRKEWQRLIDASSKVEIVAIANPDSGPGKESNLDYAAIFTEASNHGIKLVGYVSTDYGKRPQAEIKKDVDAWIRFYPQVRGFFFDQQPSESQHAAHFAELREFVKRRIPDALVITNPGVPCDEAYLSQAVSNVTCVFVNYQGFEQFELPATLKALRPRSLCCDAVQHSRRRNHASGRQGSNHQADRLRLYL